MTTAEMDKYEYVKVLGSGTSAVTHLVRHKETKELLAMKCIPRGQKIDGRVIREIINHRSLWHPNIVRFKKVALTPTHLAILMEYAAGGELFDRIIHNGRFCEDEARYFFQQLISGVSYLHKMQICHRDLKLENTLLDGSSKPQVKICDFGYSKNILLHSRTKSMVGTTAYVAPEALSIQEYDGKHGIQAEDIGGSKMMTDVWACGVTLYIMLVGQYPFVDKDDKKNVRKTVRRIMSVQYEIPENVHLSEECMQLFSRIFIADPKKRITVKEIKEHPWFLKNLPMDLTEEAQTVFHKRSCGVTRAFCSQTVTEIMKIVREASIPPPPNACSGFAEDEGKEVQERKVGKRG